MDQSSAIAFLESLWCGIDLEELKCCQCGSKIGSDAVLARTFALQSQRATDERLYAERVEVPRLSEVLLVYHRHLECLFQSTQFITISHVWPSLVAQLQCKGTEIATCAEDVARIVREDPVRICLGLTTNLMGLDIWHDYISVPQWQPILKGRIIQAIPQIFNQAKLTIACLSDIDAQNVKAMQEGETVYDRCRGISNICNAKWFSRVWTAMEHTQSRELRAMFKDYTLIEELDIRPSLVEELDRAWEVEVRKQGNAWDIEKMVGMGNNLVPWQLGYLELVRVQNLRGTRTKFAIAYDLLARRCVTNPQDFFHALLGILELDLTEPQLSRNRGEAMLEIAKSCIAEGDYSPLFMIPASAQAEPSVVDIQSHGYHDLVSFAMGAEIMPPTFKDIRFHSGNPVIQAQHIGVVQDVRRIGREESALSRLSILLRLTLKSTGLDVDELVKTIGGRLYGQDPSKIFERLSEGDRMFEFRDKLSAFYDSYPQDPDGITSWIAEAMGLSNTTLENPVTELSPMNFLEAHGGTLHLRALGAVVSLTCLKCHKSFLLLVALLKPASYVLGVKAYRIPGLKYKFTHTGGVGFLLKDSRIVGRFIWGTPTCMCFQHEDVEVLLDDLPSPRPNHTEYGQQTDQEWYPLIQENQIRV